MPGYEVPQMSIHRGKLLGVLLNAVRHKHSQMERQQCKPPMLLTMPRAEATPDYIMQIGMGFWASKALLSAVELGVFTCLADGPMTGHEIEPVLGLNPRGTHDFLDALVALGLLARDGDGATGQYRNTAETAALLDRKSPQYIGGILEMANARLYRFWADLTPALKTGKPQNEVKHSGRSMFDELYADPQRLEQFMDAMAGISAANFAILAETFDFSPYGTLADIGGASGQLSCLVASRHRTCPAAHAICLS